MMVGNRDPIELMWSQTETSVTWINFDEESELQTQFDQLLCVEDQFQLL